MIDLLKLEKACIDHLAFLSDVVFRVIRRVATANDTIEWLDIVVSNSVSLIDSIPYRRYPLALELIVTD